MNIQTQNAIPPESARYMLITRLDDDDYRYEFYKKNDKRFILIDTFADFEFANEESKKIIRNSGKFNHLSRQI